MCSKTNEASSTQTAAAVGRRELLSVAGTALAGLLLGSAAAAPAYADNDYPGDLAILNVALGLEHEAIAAYDAGAKSKLLTPDQLKIAVSFQDDHKRHRKILTEYIRIYHGTPVAAKSSYDFGVITSAADIVKLAQKLENGAENAYLANAYKLQNREILNSAVPILEDETRHNTVFKELLGMNVTERKNY